MPIFEYRCNDCGNIDEYLEKFDEKNEHPCSKCKSKNTVKVFGSFAASIQQTSNSTVCNTASSCPTGTCPLARG